MMSTLLPVTLVTTAAAAILNLWLSVRVGRMRHVEKVSIGDGGSEPLIRRMRAQANFVENAPFVLLLIFTLELGRGTGPWLWAASGLFVLGRILHGLGMDGGALKTGRAIGTGITMALLLVLAVAALVLVYQGGQAGAATPVETIVPPA